MLQPHHDGSARHGLVAAGVRAPRASGHEERAQRALLDESASRDAALAHGQPAAPTLTAAWSEGTPEA